MKNFFIAATLIGCFSAANTLKAQDVIIEKEERIEKKEKPGKRETQEITIRKDGEKEMNLKVEINGDKITVNGKPLAEFKDSGIVINKRKMILQGGGNKLYFNDDNGGGQGFNFGDAFGEDFLKDMEGGANSNKAFLGVITDAAEGGGVVIKDIVKGSAAENAGLKKGDIITKIGDEKITSPAVLSDIIGFKKPKDEVKINYKRDGKASTAKVVLGNRNANKVKEFTFKMPQSGENRFNMPGQHAPLTNMEGFNEDMMELSQNALESSFPLRKKIGLKIQDTEEGGNVKVINVEDSSAAAIAGIKKDDLITEINGTKINNTDEAREELIPDEDKKVYKIKVKRNGEELSFDVKIPRKLKTANL
jgi:serine protease Do